MPPVPVYQKQLGGEKNLCVLQVTVHHEGELKQELKQSAALFPLASSATFLI